MITAGMDTLDLLDAVKESAVLGDNLAAWPDWPASKLMLLLTQRAQSLVSTENVTANSGYANQEEFVTCVAGTDLYPLPDRSTGNTLRMLEYQVPGQLAWQPLERIDVTDTRYYDRGPTSVNTPQTFAVKDGWVELYPSPNAAFVLRMTFFLRPSMIVTCQDTATAGDGSAAAVRGLVSAPNKVARTLSVNVLPKNMLASGTPDLATTNLVDIIHPAGNFNVVMYSVPVTVAGLVLTLGGTADMTRVRAGDYVRFAEQADWPVNFPPEFHRMIANRAAMEVLTPGGPGRAAQAATLGLGVQADLLRYREVIRPQVKNAPVKIPILPMFARGGRRWLSQQ